MAASQDRRLFWRSHVVDQATGDIVKREPAPFVPKPRGKRPPNWRGPGPSLYGAPRRGQASQTTVAVQTRAIAKEQRRLAKLERTAAVDRAGEGRLRKAARRIRAFMRGGIR